MKFTYRKEASLINSDGFIHIFTMVDSSLSDPFEIFAHTNGVTWQGSADIFQPEPGECHMPVDSIRELMNRLRSAFDLSWQEQERERKNAEGRKAILGI